MMHKKWKKNNEKLKPANRELVEHKLAELYEFMEWPKFINVVYEQRPSDYNKKNSYRGYWRPSGSKLHEIRLKEFQDKVGNFNCSYARTDFNIWSPFNSKIKNFGNIIFSGPKELENIMLALKLEVIDFAPKRNVPVVLEKPVEIHFNGQGQLHREDGPTVIWRDGSRQYYWNNVEVSARFIEQEPTISYINRQWNQERKRVLIERYGEERYLKDRKAKLRAEDKYGKLWEIKLNPPMRWDRRTLGAVPDGDTYEVMVEVVNSTQEPDGTYRKFFLRVPPGMKTPKEAIAWTFKVPANKFQPVKET